MKVRQVITSDVGTCEFNASLADAAKVMWDRDCGIVPVVDKAGRIVGIITDRDVCIAATTKDRPASRIAVSDVISGHVYSIGPEDDVRTALKNMKAHKVRRLPVLDEGGALKGIVSLNDIVLHNDGTLPAQAIVETMKAIGEHPHVEVPAAEWWG